MRALAVPVAALLAALAASLPVGTARADDAGRAAARAVIARQADAFARDDAQTAYAQAAPAIRDIFPTAEVFIGMVRTQYRPVYRHRTFVFGDGRDVDAGVAQSVAIQDEDGVDWTAEYTLERGTDGEWRITGCRLIKAPGTNA